MCRVGCYVLDWLFARIHRPDSLCCGQASYLAAIRARRHWWDTGYEAHHNSPAANWPPVNLLSAFIARYLGGSVQLVDELLQFGRQRRGDAKRLPRQRVVESDGVGVQEHAFQPPLHQLLVAREVAIFMVACNGKTEMREVHADLVGASGL